MPVVDTAVLHLRRQRALSHDVATLRLTGAWPHHDRIGQEQVMALASRVAGLVGVLVTLLSPAPMDYLTLPAAGAGMMCRPWSPRLTSPGRAPGKAWRSRKPKADCAASRPSSNPLRRSTSSSSTEPVSTPPPNSQPCSTSPGPRCIWLLGAPAVSTLRRHLRLLTAQHCSSRSSANRCCRSPPHWGS